MANRICVLAVAALCCGALHAADAPPTMQSVLQAAADEDWETIPQDRLLYLYLDRGVIVFELAPAFAPQHVANVKTLAEEHYWDGLAILRSQDNYVAQWGDPDAGSESARSFGTAKRSLQGEFFRESGTLDFVAIESSDPYAGAVGFVDGMPVASDGNRVWLAHCYGMLGAGRDNQANSGSGAELYVVTGHAPRHLDRNVTLLGRALQGIEHLSSLPRGGGALGFYVDPSERVPIRRVRLGSDLPSGERVRLQRMRTDSESFAMLVDARRTRAEEWFVDPGGQIGLCNVPIPVRPGD